MRLLSEQAENEEGLAPLRVRGTAACRAANTPAVGSGWREVERLQQEKRHDRKDFLARTSTMDPEADVIRNGEGGTVPSYNVQVVTDTEMA